VTTMFGLSDTYVKVTCGAGSMCTHVQSADVSPAYATTMRFAASACFAAAPIRITVMAANAIGLDAAVGRADLSVAEAWEAAGREFVLPLRGEDGRPIAGPGDTLSVVRLRAAVHATTLIPAPPIAAPSEAPALAAAPKPPIAQPQAQASDPLAVWLQRVPGPRSLSASEHIAASMKPASPARPAHHRRIDWDVAPNIGQAVYADNNSVREPPPLSKPFSVGIDSSVPPAPGASVKTVFGSEAAANAFAALWPAPDAGPMSDLKALVASANLNDQGEKGRPPPGATGVTLKTGPRPDGLLAFSVLPTLVSMPLACESLHPPLPQSRAERYTFAADTASFEKTSRWGAWNTDHPFTARRSPR